MPGNWKSPHCWWKCNRMQPLGKTVWWFFKNEREISRAGQWPLCSLTQTCIWTVTGASFLIPASRNSYSYCSYNKDKWTCRYKRVTDTQGTWSHLGRQCRQQRVEGPRQSSEMFTQEETVGEEKWGVRHHVVSWAWEATEGRLKGGTSQSRFVCQEAQQAGFSLVTPTNVVLVEIRKQETDRAC